MAHFSGLKNAPVEKKLTVSEVLSDLLFTAAVIIALYLLWMVWFTGIIAQIDQDRLAAETVWDLPENDGTKLIPQTDNFPCLTEPANERDMIGRVYIPKFGKNYVRNLVQGTNRTQVLDLQGYGHYEKTQMPGCIGNFASAAHRGGYGESLARVQELKKGDTLIIRSQKYWFVYEITNYEITDPNAGEVIFPIPRNLQSFVEEDAELKAKAGEYKPKSKNAATERLLTFTTCHPRWGSTQRYIVYAKLDYWGEVKKGTPEELLEIGFKVKG